MASSDQQRAEDGGESKGPDIKSSRLSARNLKRTRPTTPPPPVTIVHTPHVRKSYVRKGSGYVSSSSSSPSSSSSQQPVMSSSEKKETKKGTEAPNKEVEKKEETKVDFATLS